MLQTSQKGRADELLRSARRLTESDRYDSAVLALDQAIHCAPAAHLYDYRGVVLSLLGRVEEALASFAEALARTSSRREYAEVYFHQGLLYAREGGYDRALLDFNRARHLFPANPTYREAIEQIKRERAAQEDSVGNTA